MFFTDKRWVFKVSAQELKKHGRVGKSPSQRVLEEHLERGAIILDKPAKVSCRDLVVHLKNILGIKKAAHVGTLDPGVTGVLPILLGKSVKINHYLSKKDKEYVVLMHLHGDMREQEIRKLLESFVGVVEQTPPKKSAVKRRTRKRKIYSIDVIEIKSRYVLFRTYVEAGTYIRTLCKDFGLLSGKGAHMQELRRTLSCGFREEESINFYDFHEKALLCRKFGRCEELKSIVVPIEEVIQRNFKCVFLKDSASSSFVYGASVYSQGIVAHEDNISDGEIVGLFSMVGEALGLGLWKGKNEDVRIMPLSVISSREDYPKMW